MADNFRTGSPLERDRFDPGASSSASGVVDTVKEKAKEFGSSASQFAGEAKDKVQEWASDAADVAGQVKDKAQEYASTALHKAEELGEDVTTLIRRYPVPALLIAFGIGFMAARMIRRA